ncbi:hypothetical protein EVAR_67289_1 [Eumeta japonica]|uniref:Uncharacterized protein n=1 Tax=Eumeta variegata TaxID=151549 RepID=A0A4C1ZTT5_EUMVA|nr:hypothetical protein EVAR_67289_1 [Eumeta japonica]
MVKFTTSKSYFRIPRKWINKKLQSGRGSGNDSCFQPYTPTCCQQRQTAFRSKTDQTVLTTHTRDPDGYQSAILDKTTATLDPFTCFKSDLPDLVLRVLNSPPRQDENPRTSTIHVPHDFNNALEDHQIRKHILASI